MENLHYRSFDSFKVFMLLLRLVVMRVSIYESHRLPGFRSLRFDMSPRFAKRAANAAGSGIIK